MKAHLRRQNKTRNARQKWRFPEAVDFASIATNAPSMNALADGSLAPHATYQPIVELGTPTWRAVPPGVTPQAYVSGAAALVACTNAGKRLCAPVEWRAACGGSNGYAFPYGPNRVPQQMSRLPAKRRCSSTTRRHSRMASAELS